MIKQQCPKCHHLYGFDPFIIKYKKFLFWTIAYKIKNKCPYCGHKPKY